MSDNKTIAKNTLFLYFRMILVMAVGLYTSRIVLRELGVSDYGIYSLVGGFITIFGFLNAAMSSATQRYLTFDLGKEDFDRLRKTFSISLTIHAGIAILVLLMAETVGLWYVNYKMIFPIERSFAVNVVYQFSILASLVGIIQVPYNALIIAHERMGIYAYVSIAEVLLKLIIVFLLVYFGNDKLITYAVLVFIVALGIRLFYQFYCRKHYPESRYKFYRDKKYYKELMSFSSWTLFGNMAVMARNQGSNILLNLFFGPALNAAYALTQTVQGAVGSFVNNFQIAVNPQITKSYASGQVENSLSLTLKSSKLSYYIMLLMVMPFLSSIDYIVTLWLREVPDYTISFLKIAIIITLVEAMSDPIRFTVYATGKIKLYQIIISVIIAMSFPLVWLAFEYTKGPNYLFWILLLNSIAILIYRVFYLKNNLGLKLMEYLKTVLIPLMSVTILTVIFSLLMEHWLGETLSFWDLVIKSLFLIIGSLTLIYLIGLSRKERYFITRIILNYSRNR